MQEITGEENHPQEKDNTDPALQTSLKKRKVKEPKPEVVVVRNFKEYIGESLLIIFSVILALVLTEVFNKIHENQQTSEVLHQLRLELIDNKRQEEEQYHYHLQVLKNIDSALRNTAFAEQFIHNGELSQNLKPIVPREFLFMI